MVPVWRGHGKIVNTAAGALVLAVGNIMNLWVPSLSSRYHGFIIIAAVLLQTITGKKRRFSVRALMKLMLRPKESICH